MTGKLSDHTSTKTNNLFGQEAFEVAPGVLDFVEDALNTLTDMVENVVKLRWILFGLVGTFGGPDPIAGLFTHLGLPFGANEALVAKDVGIAHMKQDRFSRFALISAGRNQFITDGQPVQGTERDQFVAEVMHLAAGAVAIVRTTSKITVAFAALVTQHWDWLGVQQKLSCLSPTQQLHPTPPQFFNEQTQTSCPTIELALIDQIREQAQMIGAYVCQKLRFAWVRDEIHRQYQCDHLAIAEPRLRPWLSFQQLDSFLYQSSIST
jgi:hypothetical protein